MRGLLSRGSGGTSHPTELRGTGEDEADFLLPFLQSRLRLCEVMLSGLQCCGRRGVLTPRTEQASQAGIFRLGSCRCVRLKTLISEEWSNEKREARGFALALSAALTHRSPRPSTCGALWQRGAGLEASTGAVSAPQASPGGCLGGPRSPGPEMPAVPSGPEPRPALWAWGARCHGNSSGKKGRSPRSVAIGASCRHSRFRTGGWLLYVVSLVVGAVVRLGPRAPLD